MATLNISTISSTTWVLPPNILDIMIHETRTKGFQGRGYGKEIMKELTESYDDDISLTVDKDNIGAIKLYEKFCFEQVEDKGSIIRMVRRAK